MGNSIYETLSSLLYCFILFLGPYFSSDLISPLASIWSWWWLRAFPSYLWRFYWQWSVRLIRVSLKKLVEQQAFEFLLILSTCSRFDAESALELRYLIIIGYWESGPIQRFVAQFKAGHPADMVVDFGSGRRGSWLLLILFGVCKCALCFELWPKHLVVFNGGIHCWISLPDGGTKEMAGCKLGPFLELGSMYSGDNGISLFSAC